MSANNNGMSEYFKIIRQFIKCHAGEGDAVSARQAVEAITPAAVQGDINAQMLLGKYYSWGYHNDCPDGIAAEQRKALTLKGQRAFPPMKSEYESRLIFISDENQVRLKRELNGKIIETAGHTSDSISLFLNDGCLFCGDAAMNGFLSKHNITIWAEDSVAFLQSWNSIIALQPAKIFPGHGKPFDVRFLKRNVGFAEKYKIAYAKTLIVYNYKL